MRFKFYDATLGSLFGISDNFKEDEEHFPLVDSTIKFLWNRNKAPLDIVIDNVHASLLPNQIITTTYLQHVSFKSTNLPITAILFNREFYCIVDHDSEVSCNGILFFGTQHLPVVSLQDKNLQRFNLLYDIFLEEFGTPDTIQGDMLQMLLKRFIILATRLAKEQLEVKKLDNAQIEVIRKFNYLVDMHYKEKRKVADYAELLFKSPKTLSNLFAIYNQKSPQKIILERLVLEAKRLIHFTDKQNQEIAFELGFNDPAHFSRFFKKMTTKSPSQYRESI
ncbi:helix-turn-helix domain-containing protein [Croceitalea dokdonensis]|nr:helix-turn-helix domain-containing protein [Croceitalea dokdonensis]